MKTTSPLAAVCVLVLAAAAANGAGEYLAESPSAVADCLTLDRIFGSKEFEVNRIGDVRWLADGSSFTTLEDSPADDSSPLSDQSKATMARDIIRLPDHARTVRHRVRAHSRPERRSLGCWRERSGELLLFEEME